MNPESTRPWIDPVRVGLIGGAVALQLALVGMVAAFQKHPVITGVLNMGTALFLGVLFLSGYVAADRLLSSGRSRGWAVAGAVVAGLMAAAVLAGLVLVGSVVNLRDVFVNASQELYHILTFTPATVAPVTGIPTLLAVGAVMALVAGLGRLLPRSARRPLAVGIAATLSVGVLADQIRLILANNGLEKLFVLLMGRKGLSPLGAVVVFVVFSVAMWLWDRRGHVVQARLAAQPPQQQRLVAKLALMALIVVLLALPKFLGSYHSDVMNQIGLFVLMGLGLNIVVGFAGMLDLGYVAFFAIGAYTVAILTSPESFLAHGHPPQAPLTFWGALPFAFLMAVLAGVLLGVPVLPLRGDYLAIVTLGFGEIIKILALSDWLKPYLGGAQGIAGIPPISIPLLGITVSGPDKPQKLFYFILAACLLVAFVAVRLKDSRTGRAWMAIREDEDVAQAVGIRLVGTKLMAFAIGAGFASLAGALFAEKLGSIYPHSFNLLISINVLSLIIVGGMGNIAGVVVGALVLVGLPELLREFDNYRLLVYGAVLVFMMLKRPAGLLPDAVHRRELAQPAINAAPPTAPAAEESA